MVRNKKNILIVVAHPDDEVLGCGGTIAKYANNNEIYVAILGEGISSRYGQREKAKRKELLELQKQSQKVGRVLGVKENFFFNVPDNRFDTVPFLDIVKKIESIIVKVKPERVYTHHSGDLNIDHRITFQAVLTATRPTGDSPVREIYAFEVPSSTEWSFQKLGNVFDPNVFEDISGSIEVKLEVLKIYEGEIRKYPHPRSPKALTIIAQRWGIVVGKVYVEPFELIRRIVD